MRRFGLNRWRSDLTYCLPNEPVPPVIRIALSLNILIRRLRVELSCRRHAIEALAALEQLVVWRLSNHAPSLDLDDCVTTADSAQTMCDEHNRQITRQTFDGVHH